jgi:MFS superfamily sulfate permease-like transporter
MRMERVLCIDQSELHAMDDAIRNLRQEGIVVAFSGLQDQPSAYAGANQRYYVRITNCTF